MYYETFGQFKKSLGQLDKWLEAAATFAQSRSFDPNVFVGLRLAPDQFPFARQVQIACDTAKLATARLAGKEAPSHADTEQTLEDLHARVRTVIAYLDGFTVDTSKDFFPFGEQPVRFASFYVACKDAFSSAGSVPNWIRRRFCVSRAKASANDSRKHAAGWWTSAI